MSVGNRGYRVPGAGGDAEAEPAYVAMAPTPAGTANGAAGGNDQSGNSTAGLLARSRSAAARNAS